MSFTYDIEPQHGRFPDVALAVWRVYLAGVPSRPLEDDRYQVFERVADRDAFAEFATRTGIQHSDMTDYVTLTPEKITVDVLSRAFAPGPLAQFLTGFAARWPIRIIGVFGHDLTIQRFCQEIGTAQI
jgi:hypothetical protein